MLNKSLAHLESIKVERSSLWDYEGGKEGIKYRLVKRMSSHCLTTRNELTYAIIMH